MTNQRLVAASISIAVASSLHAQTHVFVDDDAPDGGDGLSWNSAFNDLHDAIDLAVTLGQNRGEIRIGEGFYPAEGNPFEIPLAAKDQTPMRVFGGYAGYSFPSQPDLRVVDNYRTILSSEGDSTTIVLTSAVTLGPAGGGRPLGGLLSATTLDGLTVRGGEATAIYNTDRFLSFRMNNCSVIGVKSRSGGAVNLKDLNVWIDQSLFALNEYGLNGDGGALHVSGGSSVIFTSDFIGNSSKNMGGGAVRMNGGIHWITDCNFYANTSRENGGAIYADVDMVQIQRSEFSGNEVTRSSRDGGAAWIRVNKTVADSFIVNSLFTDNEALGHGGAVALQYHSLNSNAYNIQNTEFYNNTANESGGAISRTGLSNKEVVADSCIFIDNTARDGGALSGNVSAYRSSFVRNSAIRNGGAVCGESLSHIDQCEFFDNYAGQQGGGVHAVSAITLSNFDGNIAGVHGGVASNIRRFVSVVASNNTAPTGAGGYDIREVRHSDIHHNIGGGLAGEVVHVENTTISDNTSGDGIALADSGLGGTFSLLSSTIERNQGHGVSLVDPVNQSEIVVSNSVIADNIEYGIALMDDDSIVSHDIYIDKCVVAGNAEGGLTLQTGLLGDSDTISVIDSLFHTYKRPAIDIDFKSDVLLAGCTIIGNDMEEIAPVVIGVHSTLIAESTIIDAQDSPNTIDLSISDALLIQCMLTGGIGSIDVFSQGSLEVIGKLYDELPGFISRAGTDGDPATWRDNDYRLASGSSAIDRGSSLVFPVGRDTDLDGLDRRVDDSGMPDDGIGFAPFADIGAYEFQGTTCAGDLNNNGITDPGDFSHWIAAYNTMSRRADQNFDGVISPPDFIAWLANYSVGCK